MASIADWPVRAIADRGALVDAHRVAFDQGELAGKEGVEIGQSGEAATVAFDGHDRRATIEQGTRQAAGAGADFIDASARERAGDGGDPGKQLPVEDEILAERLARLEPVAGDDVT